MWLGADLGLISLELMVTIGQYCWCEYMLTGLRVMVREGKQIDS